MFGIFRIFLLEVNLSISVGLEIFVIFRFLWRLVIRFAFRFGIFELIVEIRIGG